MVFNGILQLAAFLESQIKDVEIEVLDCQAKSLDWEGLEREIESFNPDVVEHQELLPKLRRSGLSWVLLGVESNSQKTLNVYKK